MIKKVFKIFFYLITSCIVVLCFAQFYFYITVPYNIWIKSNWVYAFPNECPDFWNFSDLENTTHRDDLMKSGIVRSIYHGGEGIDTIEAKDSNNLMLDGLRYTSFEVVDATGTDAPVQNLYAYPKNIINLLAPALINLEEDTITIKVDPGVDPVFVDSCVLWSLPKLTYDDENDEMYWTFTVKDKYQNRRIVHITKGAELDAIPPGKILKWTNLTGMALKSE